MTDVNIDTARAELEAKLAALETENNTLKGEVTLDVSPKGCVMIRGIRRFPITLYADEMETVLGMKEEILEFIQKNPQLPRK